MTNLDQTKVDEMTLALLYLVTDLETGRVWKSFDWDTMDRLHRNGFISDPHNKNRSVIFSEEGLRLSKELFKKHFLK